MTDINKNIIELIGRNKSIKEISSILGISEKQFFVRLKQIINYGYQIIPSYSYNSDIYYKLVKDNYTEEKNVVKLKMPNSIKEFRCIVISDNHIGNVDSDINLLNYVYEYATKNNINIILNCGDLIEGVHSTYKRNLNDIYDQIETIIKKYPYDKNINNFVIFGNHDYHSLHYDGLDIGKRIKNARYDIIPIGFGKGIVKLKEDSLLLEHELSVVENPNLGDDIKLVISGHGHMMKTKPYDRFYLCAPTLSYVYPDKNKDILPGFIDLEICFEKDKIDFVEAKHLVITPKIYEVSHSKCRIKKLFNKNNYNKWN